MMRARAALALVLIAVTVAVAAEERSGEGTFKRDTFDNRAYRLYVPRSLLAPDAPPAPLVIALHGCWQTPEDFATGTRLNEAADKRGLLVLYPQQGKSGHPSRCWNWYDPDHQTRNAGEIGQIVSLVERVRLDHKIAGGRIVAVGLSAGGFMAVNLACAAPEMIAGIGVVAGGPFRCGVGMLPALDCMRGLKSDAETSANLCLASMGGKRARPLRASLWHGVDDVVVSPANLPTLAAMLARIDGATANVTTDATEAAVHTTFRDASGRPLVESWLVRNMGHAWSGGDIRGTHTYPAGPDSTTRILDFLLRSE
ncbi:MAG: PHB depolymerase family esterase [Candidatus Rokubacteria bacterium]|nr:PHB depolymerase family esterase [Candidatus Rokubacteria bacterium]